MSASKKNIVASLDASFNSTKPTKAKAKKKKMSGDARRRAKKRKQMETGGGTAATTKTSKTTPATTTATATATTSTLPTTTSTTDGGPEKKRKKNRKNVKCKCSRCGRTLQKKNLKTHLEKGGPEGTGCDGTRPTFDPKHVPMHVRLIQTEANTKTDESLMDMFAAYCQKNQLLGSDEDFTTWRETVLDNAEETMKEANAPKPNQKQVLLDQQQKSHNNKKRKEQEQEKKKAKNLQNLQHSQHHHRQQSQQDTPLPSVYSGKAVQPRRESTGVKKKFADSDDEEEE